MSGYDSLVGQSFRRRGERFTIVRCEGAIVRATVQRPTGAESVSVPLAEALEALEVPEITVTELPPSRQDRTGA
jgi:hypothetical protein